MPYVTEYKLIDYSHKGPNETILVTCRTCLNQRWQRPNRKIWRCWDCWRQERKLGAKYKSRREQARDYQYTRRHTDPLYKLTDNLRSLLLANLRYKNHTSKGITLSLLGISTEEIKNHFSTCLQNGCVICRQPMTTYHIAHLRPCCGASSRSELLELFRLENLALAHPICNLRLRTKTIESN